VTGLVRASSRRDHVEPFVDRFVTGSHEDETSWPDFLRAADCVIHNSVDRLAFAPGAAAAAAHRQGNLLGSISLLEASHPRQFVFISTIAVHHDMRARWGGRIDEDHPLRPVSAYGAYKAAVEAHLWAAHFGRGQHTCALRPCAVYGIDPDRPRSIGYPIIEQLRRGQAFTRPGGGKFVHVDDVAAAVVATVGNPDAAGRPFNLVDCYARWADWASFAADILGVTVDIDRSSPPAPKNQFTKDAAHSLGVSLDRGNDGIRTHLRELLGLMP
jgi:nucleoside-diphosphate-sugar epimerase